MSYDLLIEPVDGEPFERAAVEQALAGQIQLRRHDAESYRSAGGLELIVTADRPGAPVDSLALHLPYAGLPQSFDGACDLALTLARALGGRVFDAQLAQVVTPETRAASAARAVEAALWARRLGTEFSEPAKRYVDEPAALPASSRAVPGGEGSRPWWKFWERD